MKHGIKKKNAIDWDAFAEAVATNNRPPPGAIKGTELSAKIAAKRGCSQDAARVWMLKYHKAQGLTRGIFNGREYYWPA